MSKRISGPPRRPRNPVAKAVRTPQFKMQVVEDKRDKEKRHRARQEIGQAGSADEPRPAHQNGDAPEDCG